MSSTSASLVNNLNRKRPSIDTPVITNRGPLFSFIDFNTGEFCNRKCSFCPRAEPLEYPNQKIFSSLRLAKALASQLNALNYSGLVNLCGYGEPLANPEILDIIEVLSPTCSLELVTHGEYLNVELVQQLYSQASIILLLVLMMVLIKLKSLTISYLNPPLIHLDIQFVTDGPLKMIMAC